MTEDQKLLLKLQTERVVVGSDITDTTLGLDGETPAIKTTHRPLVKVRFPHDLY